MMNEKLILTVEKSVIKQAREYAEKTGNTLSSLVENYLKSFSNSSIHSKNDDLSPIVKTLKGAFKTTEINNYKDELETELSKKYEQ